jgi:hypothetical protein
MGVRTVVWFLVKVLVLLSALLVAWHQFALARFYHTALAALTDACYRLVPLGGHVHGVWAGGSEFLARVIVGGKSNTLHIVASDITSNFCALLALYLASPVGRPRRDYAAWLVGSVAALMAIHVVTVTATIQTAVAGHPAYSAGPGPGARACGNYLLFYESVGMYLLVLVLWLPYVLVHMKVTRNRPATQ